MADEDEREATRKRYTSRTISIKVGAAENAITVQEDILQEDSPVFKAMLEKDWKEKNTATVELPEDEIDIVAAYVHWLYRNEIVKVKLIQNGGFYAKLYAFGEKMQSKGFCNSTLHAIIQRVVDNNSLLGPASVKIIYNQTPAGSPMRKFCAETYAERGAQHGWFINGGGDCPHQFLLDLARELFARRSPQPNKKFFDHREKWEKK